ncbi:MAG: heavy-metal-associated domain-containing protein [Sphingomicrobium sp.]
MRDRSGRTFAGELDDARLDDDAALAKRGISVATAKHPPDAGGAADPAARKAWPCTANAAAAAREIGGGEDARKIFATALAAARAFRQLEGTNDGRCKHRPATSMTLIVSGMTRGGCASAVERVLRRVTDCLTSIVTPWVAMIVCDTSINRWVCDTSVDRVKEQLRNSAERSAKLLL